MTEMPAARPSGRDLLVRQEASENFELARHGGDWMVVTGFIVALSWIFGAAGMAIGLWGVDGLMQLPPLVLAGGALGALVPALLMIMAGYMGRTNRRAAASNALVMEAAVRLMAPAREAGTEGITFAEQMKQAAAEVDHAMAHALTAMKAMAGEIGDERMRLESVAYASADNARDLTERLALERQALEGLARELKAQMQSLNEAIPRQAQMMVKATREASEEVARADEALEARLETMQVAGQTLAEKLVELDGLARDAASRTETLTFAVSRVEEKLDQSRRTVDAAVRAGEIAAAAAMTTGDALKDAVSSALDGARLANKEITESTREAAESAARALAQLQEAGERAAASLRSADYAARAETVRVERKADLMPSRPAAEEQAATPAAAPEAKPHRTPATEPKPQPGPESRPSFGLEAERSETPREPEGSLVLESRANGKGHANGHTNGHANGHAPVPKQRPLPRSSVEDELFDAAADALASAITEDEGQQDKANSPLPPGGDTGSGDADPVLLRRRHDDPSPPAPKAPEHPLRRATDFAQDRPAEAVKPEPPAPVSTRSIVPSSGTGVGWRDIISDMSREDEPPRDREEVAEQLLDRLQSSGIMLPETFRPKAKRKIAEAARKGEKERKSAILAQAGRQVERVTQRLRNDRELMRLARDFVSMEAEDALQALEQTQKTGRNASPRLAAYLLIDAAL